jgi:peptidoglycan/LPS O-acetylase OafA/YrhL
VKERNFGLDVIRALSILFVIIAHRFNVKYEIGVVGVQIFFILSGFLIGQILLKDFQEHINFNKVIHFWKRRWFRTLPLYYLVLIFKIMLYGNPYGWKMIVYFLFLQANILGINFFGVSWSLVVEEWFYLFLPLATLFFLKKGITAKRFICFLSFFIVLFFIVRYSWNYFHKGIIIYQFDCLLLGVGLAAVKLFYFDYYKKLSSAYLFCLGLLGTSCLTVIYGDVKEIPLYDTFYRVIWFFLISIFILLIVPFIEQNKFINQRIKKIKFFYYFFTWTSILTYSIYLLHMEVFHLNFLLKNEAIIFTIQMIILYAICYFIYCLYEHPMMMLRDKFSVKQYIKSIKLFSF